MHISLYLNLTIYVGSCYSNNSDQFTCNNGNCISKTQKCDKVNNCGDNSDEFGCGKDPMCVTSYMCYGI